MPSTLPPSLADLSLEGRVDNMLYMRVYCHYHLYILFILLRSSQMIHQDDG